MSTILLVRSGKSFSHNARSFPIEQNQWEEKIKKRKEEYLNRPIRMAKLLYYESVKSPR